MKILLIVKFPLRGRSAVAIFVLYCSPTDEDLCLEIEENSQILKKKYIVFSLQMVVYS